MASPASMGLESFGKACLRHFDDAEYLYNDQRTANAAQLYGFSAECGVKRLAIFCGATTISGGSIGSGWRKHIHQLIPSSINQIRTNATGIATSRYFAMIDLTIGDFADWSTDHRYCEADRIPLSFPKWRTAAMQVRRMIDQMAIDGVAL